MRDEAIETHYQEKGYYKYGGPDRLQADDLANSTNMFSNNPIKKYIGMNQNKGSIIGDHITKKQNYVLKHGDRFKDSDNDGVVDGLDCEPRNKYKHMSWQAPWRKKEPETYVESNEYPNVSNENFQEERIKQAEYEHLNKYGEVQSVSGKRVGNAMIVADVVIPSGKLLTAAGMGVKKYVDKVKLVKTDEHDNRYFVPRMEIHKKNSKLSWDPKNREHNEEIEYDTYGDEE